MKAVALLALALAGCAHAPEPRIVVREMKVPVAVECAAPVPAKPAYAGDTISLDSDVFELVRSLLVEREQRKAEDVEVRAALSGCRKPDPG